MRGHIVDRLRIALAESGSMFVDSPLTLMADKGLAHDHVRLDGTGVVARLPKQSQMGLAPAENLAYQAACYARTSASGHTPCLVASIPPGAALPRGALLVEYIDGRPARLPDDLPAIVTALARIHSLPVPPATERAPLADPDNPVSQLLEEVVAQAAFLDEGDVAPATRAIIEAGIAELTELCARPARPAKHLISFDAHPGNFLIRPDGSAVLVDLEKCRYSAPPLDLAHATLYTSTTWDVASSAILSIDDIAEAYSLWERQFTGDGRTLSFWFIPLRQAMWLWSMTWCAKWRAVSGQAASGKASGEDWSQDHSEKALVEHVRDRVDHYLMPATARRISEECLALNAMIGSPR